MISGSNHQLQQQLEYILLTVTAGEFQKLRFRRTICNKILFKLGKSAAETHGMLQTVFGPSCMNRASVLEWHKRFKEGRESVKDDDSVGGVKKSIHQS